MTTPDRLYLRAIYHANKARDAMAEAERLDRLGCGLESRRAREAASIHEEIAGRLGRRYRGALATGGDVVPDTPLVEDWI